MTQLTLPIKQPIAPPHRARAYINLMLLILRGK